MFVVEIEPGKVARFRFPPRVIDRLNARRRSQELAGGARALAELEATREALLEQVSAELTEAVGAEAAQQILDAPPDQAGASAPFDDEQMLAEILRVEQGETARCMREIDAHIAYVYTLAEWPVLYQSGPRGWADLGEQQLDDDRSFQIVKAYRAARDAADREVARGKEDSSPS